MSKVFLIKNNFLHNLEGALKKINVENVKGQKVAIKLHMGEYGNISYVRPPIVGEVVEVVKEAGGQPFLFDTPTFYAGSRTTIEGYMETARKNGFTKETVGCPVVISNEGVEVKTRGSLGTVEVAKSLLVDGIIVISHAKGQAESGFSGAIKNLGMGGVTKKTKALIHTGAKPVLSNNCNGCGECIKVCWNEAITLKNKQVVFNYRDCWGCGACILACPIRALKPRKNNFRYSLAEAASAILKNFEKDKQFFINVLMDITPLCDCFPGYGIDFEGFPICRDIGILVSKDPVAIDAASMSLVEQSAGKGIFYNLHHVDCRESLEMSEKLGMGNKEFEITEVGTPFMEFSDYFL